ncbi:MAG: hypothetical protein ACOCYX_04410 [Spirochaetota bacterium]
MHRPELIYSFHRGADSPPGRGRRDGGPGGAADDAGDRASGPPDERWKLGDSLIMVVAALRVLLPYVVVILATVAAAWGLWRLAFG